MLISKFNTMIRNRFVWGFFAIIVCLSFVGVSLQTDGCSARNNSSAGTVSGRPVSFNELGQAKLFEIGFRAASRLSDADLARLEDSAWKRIATLEYAARLGVICTRQEIDSMIVSDPRFQIDGKFDQNTYEQVVQKELNISTDLLENYLAQEIILNRMTALAGTMVLTPPSELADKLEKLTDMVAAEYVVIPNDVNPKKAKLSDKEIEKYFTENIELFRVPEKMNVKYAVFPVAEYASRVSVTEQQAREYYDDHISDYSSRNKDDELVTIDFADAKDSITAKIRDAEAAYLTRDAATTFVMDLMPDREGRASPLDDVLKRHNIKLETSPFFSLLDEVPGIDAGYDFNRAAFNLNASDPEHRISDAVVGSSNVYVLIAGEKQPSRLPSFSEARSSAEPQARRERAMIAFEQDAKEIHDDIREALVKGRSFESAAKAAGLKPRTTPSFSVYSDTTNEVENSDILIPAVLKLEKGELSGLIPHDDGFMLVYLNSREKGDILSAELLKPQLISAVSQYRASAAFYSMQDYLVKKTVVLNQQPQQDAPEEDENEQPLSSGLL